MKNWRGVYFWSTSVVPPRNNPEAQGGIDGHTSGFQSSILADSVVCHASLLLKGIHVVVGQRPCSSITKP